MGNIRLFLRANEKLYVNGAVLRFDRKVAVELLNDVEFLLENHVMQAEDATTPLRQLYFVVQMMLMDPANKAVTLRLFTSMVKTLHVAREDRRLREGVRTAVEEVENGETFRALKTLRGLFETESGLLDPSHKSAKPPEWNMRELSLQEGA